MIAVNKLIDDAFSALNITGMGQATKGNYAKIGEFELNNLIANLNAQGYISLSQKFVDVPMKKETIFKKLQTGETAPANVIDMEPPEKIESVARQSGERFIALHSMDLQQVFSATRQSLPTSWNYAREYEAVTIDGVETQREVGILRLDGCGTQNVRVFINSKLPTYTLADKIYLPDLYNSMLFSGLKFALAKRMNLDSEKKAECEAEFTAASTLIKRGTITQRMLRSNRLERGYNDNYYNSMSPAEW